MNLYEETLTEELVYKGDYLDIFHTEVKLPNGKKGARDIIKHPGACAIIPFLDNENVILIEQFRKPLDKTILEIPAGKLNKAENPQECALRELQEETGYKANEMIYLGSIAPQPGFCDEIIHLFKASSLTKGEKHEDEDEFTKVKSFPLSKVKEMIREGKIIDGKTISIMAFL